MAEVREGTIQADVLSYVGAHPDTERTKLLTEAASLHGYNSAQIESALISLCTRGFITRLSCNGESRYRATRDVDAPPPAVEPRPGKCFWRVVDSDHTEDKYPDYVFPTDLFESVINDKHEAIKLWDGAILQLCCIYKQHVVRLRGIVLEDI